jgi:competence protein ComEC
MELNRGAGHDFGRRLLVSLLVAAAALIGAVPRARAASMVAHFIDVGQGAATLLEFSCGVVLIDVGGEFTFDRGFHSSRLLRAYLEQFFLNHPAYNRTIDLVVLSHPHLDHTRGVSELLNEHSDNDQPYTIRNVIDNAQNAGSGIREQKRLRSWAKRNARYQGIKLSSITGTTGFSNATIDPLNCADVDPQIRILWGSLSSKPSDWTSTGFSNGNNHSVIVRVDFGEASFLFPGDLMVDGERSLLKKYAGTTVLDVDVYQAAHHGADNGSGAALLSAMTPEIVVLAVGDPARDFPNMTAFEHGHPRVDTVTRLINSTSGTRPTKQVAVADGQHAFHDISISKAVYATGWDGTVIVTASDDGTFGVISGR